MTQILTKSQLFNFLSFSVLCSFLLVSCFSSSPDICRSEEKAALLQFKSHFSCDRNLDYCSASASIFSWNEYDQDCCHWDGIFCDDTGYVIGLDLLYHVNLYGNIPSNSSFFHLIHLQYLNLSGTNFGNSQISPLFGNFKNLSTLRLADCGFSGVIPDEIFQLLNLEELDLSGNGRPTGNNLGTSQISPLFGNFKNLTMLRLADCGFSGVVPNEIFQLSNIEELDLSGNEILTGNKLENSQISPLFGNFKNLSSLRLADCGFSGVVPNEIFHLSNLKELDLSGNKRLTGKLPYSIGELASLGTLSLGGCNFSGSIPTSIGNLTRLTTFNITGNHFSGKVPASLSKLVNLMELDLSYNNFEGPILHSILNLTECQTLDLSFNHFTDVVQLDMLTELQLLQHLDLSNSGLSLTLSNSDIISAFQIMNTLRLSSCGLRSNPLTNLSGDSELVYIDLSNNTIMNKLDPSICKLESTYYLDLSHNQFHGPIPTCLGNSMKSLSMLNLQGNKLHGTIPQSFGNAKNIQVLDLSNNLLHGEIPRSLVNCTELEVLNLGSNKLNDNFPFWLGDLSLKVLDLRGNNISGTITENLRRKGHFTRMHIIDMSNNYLTGTLPSGFFDSWNAMMIGDERNSSTYAYVQSKPEVRDTRCNPFKRCRRSRTGPGSYHYYYSLNIMNKGVYFPYKRVLAALKVVDFSANKFHGIIPSSVGRLKGIQVLNLSGNALTGPVPSFLVNLSNLESLDLSNNMLSGQIPRDMSNLNSLGDLDLSQNNLTGGIPKYLDKFPNASYEGNQGLCGLPLSSLCTNVDKQNLNSPSQRKHHFEFNLDGFGWEVAVVGYGCGIVIGLMIGYFIPVRDILWFVQIFSDVRQYRPRARNTSIRIN